MCGLMKKNNLDLQGANNIEVTGHVIDRYRLRHKKPLMRVEVAIRHINNALKASFLINIKGNIEQRLFKGDIFIIELKQNKIIVITVKLTKSAQMELFSPNFNLDTVDYATLFGKSC